MSAPEGFVYCLLNASMPGLIKIGATLKDPIQRARELSASTSSPVPFVVGYSRFVAYPFEVEASLHGLFNAHRTNDSREFFRMPLHKAVEALDRYEEIESVLSGVKTPWANLFASFPDDGSPRELTEDEQFRCEQLRHKLAQQKAAH